MIERPTGYTVKTVIMFAMSSTDPAVDDLTWISASFSSSIPAWTGR